MQTSFIASYTPSLMPQETLQAIFVQRHQLVEELIDLVEDSCTSRNKHFRLLVGMRGIGKTHTMSLIYHRLQKLTQLEDKLRIAWLKEEEWGVSSWLDLLLRILQTLAKEYPEEYELTVLLKLESIYELSAEDATKAAEKLLTELIGEKTLLLLTENLDEIFKGLGKIGQQQFRAYLQNHNLLTIIATSQSLFSGVSKKSVPFYGFFTAEYLQKLTIEEATSLLTKIAQNQQDSELETFIQSKLGRDRIKAIHHLAGGNHRVYIIFAQFLTRESLDELIQPVMQTLDELTPYYQARMQWLSAQQRKIIEILCDVRCAIPVKEIAKKCFITHQTASSQLKDLRDKGYVTSEAIGRASFYELQEPLMRICLEVKKQRGEPIKLFIDFLRIWYTAEELKNRLAILPEICLEREYINYALQSQAELMDSKASSSSLINQLMDKGIEEGKAGNLQKALGLFVKIIKNNSRNGEAWLNCGVVLSQLQKYEEAIAAYEKSIEIDSNCDTAFFNRGFALGKLERYEESMGSYEKAIAIKPDEYDYWFNHGSDLAQLGRYDKAIISYEKVLEINPEYYLAWKNRGFALSKLGRYYEAIASYDQAIAIKPNYYQAFNDRGFVLSKLDRHEDEIASYDQAIKINSEYHVAWYSRGCALFSLARYDEALASFDKAIELKPDYNDAWNNRGLALNSLRQYTKAIFSYEKAIAIKPDDYRSWTNRGNALANLEREEEAIASYDQALKINQEDILVYFNRIKAIWQLNRWEAGFQELNLALELFANLQELGICISSLVDMIWFSTQDPSLWKSRLQKLIAIYEKYQLVSTLSKGIANHIPELMTDEVSNQAARSWLETWQELAANKPELSIALRFLKTAVEYKETNGDRKVLLQLAKEERELLEGLLVNSTNNVTN